MKCAKCTNFATKTTEGKGHFLLYGCRKLKITFGNTTDWKAKKGQPKNCREFEERVKK